MSDSDLNLKRLPRDVCECLCTKTMYTGGGERDLVEDVPDDRINTAAYWCVLTQAAIGPDGDPVAPGECRPGRPCCRPRFRLPIST